MHSVRLAEQLRLDPASPSFPSHACHCMAPCWKHLCSTRMVDTAGMEHGVDDYRCIHGA